MSSPATATANGQTAQRVNELGPWFHNIHLPDGAQTAPTHFLGDYPSYKWSALSAALPEDLRGWRALDIGCNAGFFSVQLAKRGAEVLAIDHDDRYLTQGRWVAEQFGMSERITFRNMQVYDLARMSDRFDLILFMGVFYHLRYPTLALDIVARKVERLLVFQTLMRGDQEIYLPQNDYEFEERSVLESPGWPAMSYIEHSFAHDPTNWWVPNRAAVLAMLRSSGLSVERWVDPDFVLCNPRDCTRDELIPGNPFEYESALGLPGGA